MVVQGLPVFRELFLGSPRQPLKFCKIKSDMNRSPNLKSSPTKHGVIVIYLYIPQFLVFTTYFLNYD